MATITSLPDILKSQGERILELQMAKNVGDIDAVQYHVAIIVNVLGIELASDEIGMEHYSSAVRFVLNLAGW